jgi:putative hydroxymethylpyrimidine transport system substrate-binding protein
MRRRAALSLALAAALLAGCGGHRAPTLPALSVALDFTPNAVHAPIYAAIRDGLDRREGVRLAILTPGASPDSLKTVLSGRADIGVLDIHDLGLALTQGRDLVAVGALVQRPLAAIITTAAIARPRDLAGKRVGVSGLPSDPAVLQAVLEHDGGTLASVHQVTIGFAAVQSLVSGRIDGVPAFWNAEGVTLRRRGIPIHEFRVDDYGAPRYPEVVLVVRRATLRTRGPAVRAAVRAIAAGMRDVRAHPGPAAAEIARAGGTEVALARAQLDAVAPIFGTALHRDVLDAWNAWDVRFGILPRRVDVGRAFTSR